MNVFFFFISFYKFGESDMIKRCTLLADFIEIGKFKLINNNNNKTDHNKRRIIKCDTNIN